MYKLLTARIHQHVRALYDVELPKQFHKISDSRDIDLYDLSLIMSELSGDVFPSEICGEVKMIPEVRFTREDHGADVLQPEAIYAGTNGYSVVWIKEYDDDEV